MITLDMVFEDGKSLSKRFNLPLSIGRGRDCGLRLQHWRIAKNHCVLRRGVDGVYIEDLGSLGGTRINGRRITRFGPLKSSDSCIVGPCKIHFIDSASSSSLSDSVLDQPQDDSVHFETGAAHVQNQVAEHLTHRDEITEGLTSAQDENSKHANYKFDTQFLEIRKALHCDLIKALDLRRHDVSVLSDMALRLEAEKIVAQLIEKYSEIGCERIKQHLIAAVCAEAVGLGVLEQLLHDESISEIMVNKFDLLFIERHGVLLRHDAVFSSELAVRSIIERIVLPLGRRIDESSPMVDARLRDGSRLNAVIPPVAIHGACLTIRKFAKARMTISDLITRQSVDTLTAELLQLCIHLRLNMIVSGGTGAGKTTLLNILSQAIHSDQRLVTIEDSAELRLDHPHVISMEARPANAEGSGQISIRDLVRNAMRMRPDRIIVGEVRGAEALDMLVAMNTGHEGSLTTLHANSPRDAIARLETLILMSGVGLPLQAIREQVASAINIIVQQSRLVCGRRVITRVAEITGIESGVIQLQTLMHFDMQTLSFVRNTLPPSFFDRLTVQEHAFMKRWLA